MKTTSSTKLLAILLLALFVSSCERYTFTVNERPVFEPAPLFNGQRIPDSALAHCVEQAIADQHITQASELTSLACTHAGVTKLEGITIFTGLNQLDFSGNNLTEIKPLLFLPYLADANLTENPALNCADAQLLLKQLIGELILPVHCQ